MQSVARCLVFVASVSAVCLLAACDDAPAESIGDSVVTAPDREVSLEEISDRLHRHLEDGDVCTIFDTINELSPSFESTDELRESLRLVWTALDGAHEIVPPDLADDWAVLVTGTSDAISRLSAPDASVEDLRPVYSSSALMSAERRVDEWMADHCAA